MLYELFRAVVQRILRDKILLGLVVVGILGIFFTGVQTQKEPPINSEAAQAEKTEETAEMPQGEAAKPIEPGLACDFVKWWLGGAMDMAQTTAKDSHKEAIAWMTAEAAGQFQAALWTPQMAQGIETGAIRASFHTGQIQAEALNPDGSVVVSVDGTMILDTMRNPVPTHIITYYLVKRNRDGLRIAGVFNKQLPTRNSSVY